MNRKLCKENIKIAGKCIKRCSFYPIIESYVAKQQRYHFHLSYWQKSERLNVTNIDEDVEKQVFTHIPAEVQIMYSPFRKQTVSIYYNFKCLHSPPRYSLPGS